MTLQSDAPLRHTSLGVTSRQARWFVQLREQNTSYPDPRQGGLDLNPPYQRGSVWTIDQQRLLIKSFLLGVPVPAVIINDRHAGHFRHDDGAEDWRMAVVDGRQRLEAVLAWIDGDLTVPASWLDPDFIVTTQQTDDGPYVAMTSLTERGQRLTSTRILIGVCEAQLPTLEAEAELYLLVNRGGTAHQEQDLQVARDLTSS